MDVILNVFNHDLPSNLPVNMHNAPDSLQGDSRCIYGSRVLWPMFLCALNIEVNFMVLEQHFCETTIDHLVWRQMCQKPTVQSKLLCALRVRNEPQQRPPPRDGTPRQHTWSEVRPSVAGAVLTTRRLRIWTKYPQGNTNLSCKDIVTSSSVQLKPLETSLPRTMTSGQIPRDEPPYTLQSEARRIYEAIVTDPRLKLPEEVKGLRDRVHFTGDETDPFFPVPFKAAESQAGLLGYIGLLALTIAEDRYGIEQECQIDVSQALLNGLGALFVRHEGEWLSGSPKMMAAVQRWDHGMTRELYRQLATNIYKSKDGRWYSLHGNMNPTPLLEMLNLPQHNEKNLTWPQIIDLYSKVVGDINSQLLDDWSNNVYRTPGTLCLEKEEFESTPQGKAIRDEPYYNLVPQHHYTQPSVAWDKVSFDPADCRPLSGIKVLDLSRAIAAPTIGRVCAALGATVIRVSCSKNTELPITLIDGCIGKTSVDIDLKTFDGRKKLLELIEDADVFIDGYRPAVMEHLGFGRDAVLGLVAKRDRGLVYCQENCYGWKGPWTTRPGWAQIADTVCGIGMDIGRFHGYDEPHIFPGPNADYLTGHAGAAGVLHGLYLRSRQGGSYVVQCSLVVSNMQMQSYGKYTEEQQVPLKARNKDLVGRIRHYDEIVSHGRNENVIRGFIANRGFENAIKKEYYQKVDGSMWGLGDLDLVKLALEFQACGSPADSEAMRTDWHIGPCPPGYHLPKWERKENENFEPIQPTQSGSE
ncbi:uncharacterized protein PV07_09783 [Cladophialophora immunda]|uniref:Uncharacterized protein n=1 Tax=Cladophialophora immunda TaxID=569365 RepID=A0A0D2CKJ6_9EURO|nr:uncharacterized protein PV07_09783 [Cladophialophora immunda]KIW24044.1 hypothetical protein PV07_09783 [Cladophialophora immunda]